MRRNDMPHYPLDRFGLLRREAARAVGISDDQLRAAVRSGALLRLAPGVLAPADDRLAGPAGSDEIYRLRSIAVASAEIAGPQPAPLSFDSAAALHGLPLLKPDRSRVRVTIGRTSGGSIRRHRHVHTGSLAAEDVVTIDGIATTGLERTAVDIAVRGDLDQAVTVFDGALRLGADRDTMSAMLGGRRVGVASARRALGLADPMSESVGESWSRAQLLAAGLPAPRLQCGHRCGSRLHRVDFEWDGLIGEFDGLHKYGRLLRPGETAADAVIREKIREDQLRALGFMVVRWTWAALERRTLVDLIRPWLLRCGPLAS